RPVAARIRNAARCACRDAGDGSAARRAAPAPWRRVDAGRNRPCRPARPLPVLGSGAAGGAVEYGPMKVAGLGFKKDVALASLREALLAAGGPEGLAAVATVSDKADAEVLKQLAREYGLPIKAVSADMLADIETPT